MIKPAKKSLKPKILAEARVSTHTIKTETISLDRAQVERILKEYLGLGTKWSAEFFCTRDEEFETVVFSSQDSFTEEHIGVRPDEL